MARSKVAADEKLYYSISEVARITNLEAYQALFDGVSGEKAIGEASPSYLVEPKAPVRIQRYIPKTKMIAMLRNPAERAYSHFLHLIKYLI